MENWLLSRHEEVGIHLGVLQVLEISSLLAAESHSLVDF